MPKLWGFRCSPVSPATRLSQNDNVTVIDRDAASFANLGPDFNGAMIQGVGFDEDVLIEAGIKTCNAVAAVTQLDNTNLMIAEVCDKLSEIGVINDRRYAENLARRLVEVKLMGRYRAVNDMKQKGLPKSIIDEALAPYAEGERERLRELIEKKYMNKLDYEDRNRKVTASLVRYGYSFDDIRAVLKEIEQEL